MLEIKHERPPNFDAVAAVFPMARMDGVIFAYAPCIYVPSGRGLPPDLLAHETVHVERQMVQGVVEWWEQYLRDVKFRLEEELLAHRAEYLYLKENSPSRPVRRRALRFVAEKLASGLYGRMVTVTQAMQLIKEGGNV